jgi:hypothetical protein
MFINDLIRPRSFLIKLKPVERKLFLKVPCLTPCPQRETIFHSFMLEEIPIFTFIHAYYIIFHHRHPRVCTVKSDNMVIFPPRSCFLLADHLLNDFYSSFY